MNQNPMPFGADLPYPAVKAEQPNREYARMMLSNVGGRNSEMTAVSLYFYNHLVTHLEPDVSQAFHHISVVEMRHLEIFGELALQLGEDPRLWAQHGRVKQYWRPSYNQYPVRLPKLLLNAIDGERKAIEKYQRQAQRVDDANIVENLARIIMDERQHITIMRQLYTAYCGELPKPYIETP